MDALWTVPYLVAAIAAHALLVRLTVGGSSILKFLAAGGPLGAVLGVHVFIASGELLPAMAALTVYAFACELYLFLFTLVGTSVSVRLLLTLRGGERSRAEIEELFATAGMVELRIQRLLKAGLLEGDGVGYRATPRGRRVVALFLALKRFFCHPVVIPCDGRSPVPPACLAIDSRKMAGI